MLPIAIPLENPHILHEISAQTEQPRYGGTLVLARGRETNNLMPQTSTLDVTQISGAMFNSLLHLDPNLELHPELAQSWNVSADGLTYTFRLVKNATWHDGKPFTSADVKFTFEKVAPTFQSNYKPAADVMESITAPDNYTVIFKLRQKLSILPAILSDWSGKVMPAHIFDVPGNKTIDVLKNPAALKPIGTGPFKFVEWVRGDHLTVEKNKNYWKAGKPYLDKVIVKYIPDAQVALVALERGEVDAILANTPLNELDRLRKDPKYVVVDFHSLLRWSPAILHFNQNLPPVNDVRVRQAIEYAIDREQISKVTTFGYDSWENYKHTFPPQLLGKHANEPFMYYPPNLAKANALLDEAGYPKGPNGVRFELELFVRDYIMNIAEMAAVQLKDVGINLKLVAEDNPTETARVMLASDWRANLSPYSIVPTMPIIGVGRVLHSKGLYNPTHYSDPELDKLLEDINQVSDPNQRAEMYWRMAQIIERDAVFITLTPAPVQPYVPTTYNRDFVVGKGDEEGYSSSATAWESWYWTKGTVQTTATMSTTTSTPAAAPSTSDWGTITIAVLTIVIIGGLGAYLIKRKKHQNNLDKQ